MARVLSLSARLPIQSASSAHVYETMSTPVSHSLPYDGYTTCLMGRSVVEVPPWIGAAPLAQNRVLNLRATLVEWSYVRQRCAVRFASERLQSVVSISRKAWFVTVVMTCVYRLENSTQKSSSSRATPETTTPCPEGVRRRTSCSVWTHGPWPAAISATIASVSLAVPPSMRQYLSSLPGPRRGCQLRSASEKQLVPGHRGAAGARSSSRCSSAFGSRFRNSC